MAALPLDVNDAEHRTWRAQINKLVADWRGVIDLRSRIDLTERVDEDVPLSA